MADTKITALTALTAADPANDVIPIVDVSDTTMAASGTTKKISVNNILGASGTATLASATITGAATVGTTLGVTGVSTLASAVVTGNLTVDTSTLVVDATNDRVGVGTASPANGTKLDVAGFVRGISGAVFQGASNITSGAGLEIGYNTGSQLAFLQSFDRTTPAYKTIRLIGSSIDFDIANTVKATLDASGNLNIANGNLVMTTSGKGIDFSAVTGGTGTATGNLLNDYEEGTFMPTVVGTTADGTIGTYYAQSGIYTKVGRVVTVQVYLAYGGGTGATGDLAFAGLPFTTGNIANNYTSGAIGYFGDIALTALNVPSLFASPNTTRFLVNQFPVGGGSLTAVPYDGSGAIMFTATYFTA